MATKRNAPGRPKDGRPVCNHLELAFCHFVMQGKSYTQAALAMGLTERDGDIYAHRANVKAYLERFTDRFLERMAMAETRKMMAAGISRDAVAQQLYYLGCMPPEETKGSIDGQVTALKELAELMGFKFDPKQLPETLRRMSEADLRNYAVGSASAKPQ